MRAAVLLLLLLALMTLSASGRDGRAILGGEAAIRAVPVPLDASDPGRVRVGALTYLGGVRLESPDPAFGGFSAMQVKGDRFTLVSDGGNLVRFRMGSDWTPRDVTFGDVPGGPETGWNKGDRDVESLTWDPATGKIWLGFERWNQIWRYDPALTRPERHAAPEAMQRWPANGGAESMVRLADGRFAVIAESARPKGSNDRIGLLFPGDPAEAKAPPLRFAYRPPAGYDPSEAAALPDGRLIVLNRRISIPDLFTARLTLVDTRAIREGATVEGVEIAAFAAPLLHDNYEALAVTREGEDTILWIAADDNGEWWEQSLLLKFRIEFGSPLPATPPHHKAGKARPPRGERARNALEEERT